MLCPTCGAPVSPDAQFCGHCGQAISHQPVSDGTSSPRNQGAYGEPELQAGEPRGILRSGDVAVRVEGELVPVVDVELGGSESVYFEHHVLLWKEPRVGIGLKPLKGMVKRMFAGLQIFVTEAGGPGNISFSRDAAGQIVSLPLEAGQEIHVREHQFLLATDGIAYDYFRIRGVTNILFGGTGFFIDRFVCQNTGGLLLVHGYGNVFTKILAPGESIDVEPGAFLWKDASVKIDTIVTNLSTGLFGGTSFTLNRFTGPGRLGIQSMTFHEPVGVNTNPNRS